MKNVEASKVALAPKINMLMPGSGIQKFQEKTFSKDKNYAGQKYDLKSYFQKESKTNSKREEERELAKESAIFDRYAKENKIESSAGNNKNNLPHNSHSDPNVRNITNNLNTKNNIIIPISKYVHTGQKTYTDLDIIRKTANDTLRDNNIDRKIPGRSDGSFLFDHLKIDRDLIDQSKYKDTNQNNKLQGLIDNKESSLENKMLIDCEVRLDKEKSYDLDNTHHRFSEKNDTYTNNGSSNSHNHILPSKISYKQEDPYRLIKFSPEEIYEKVLDFKFYKNKEVKENTQFIIPESFTSGNHYKYIWIVNFLFEMKHALLSSKIENSEKSKYRGDNVKIALRHRNEIVDTKVIVYSVTATKSLNFHKHKIFKENDIFAIYQEEDFKKNNVKPGNISSDNQHKNDNNYDFTLTNTNNLPYFIGVVNYERCRTDSKSNDFICRVNRDYSSVIKEDCQYSVQLLGNLTTFLREYFSIIQMNELVLSEALLNPKLFYSQNQMQTINCNEYDNGNKTDNIFLRGFNDMSVENKLSVNRPKDSSKSFVQKIMNSSFFNKSQKEAIYMTSQLKSKDLLLIQGPPGTGKTHTIIGILSLFFLQNPSARIIICAPSNNAVDEIAIRLAKTGLLDINLNYFTPDFIRFGLFDREEKEKDIDTNPNHINSDNLNILQKYSLEKQIEDRYMEKEKLIHDKLEKYKTKIEEASNKLDKCYAKIDELKSNSSAHLTQCEKEDQIKKYQKGIEKYYQIKKELKNQKENLTLEKKDNLNHKKFYEKQLLEKTRILCTTLNSAGNERIRSHNINYDYMILDEACQCVEPSALIPLHLGVKKVIMVGDHMQLPATVFSDKASLLRYNRSYFERLIDNQYKKNHILTIQYRMHSNIRNFIGKAFYDEKLQDDENSQKTLNDSVLFKLIKEKHNFSMFDLKNSQEKLLQASKSYININEAKFVVNLLLSIQGMIDENNKTVEDGFIDYFDHKIEGDMDKKAAKNKKTIYLKYAIISPYKAQVKLLREEISKYCHEFLPLIEVNTVDSFQGREQDIVIISTVRSNSESNYKANNNFNSIGFLNDHRRMNVALSRGKLACFVVGSAKTLIYNEYWQKLIDYCLHRESLFPIRDSYFKYTEAIHPLNRELILNFLKTGKPFKITREAVVKNKQIEEGEVEVIENIQEFITSIGLKSEYGKLNFDLAINPKLYQEDINELKKSIENFKRKKENDSWKFENNLQDESKLLSRKTNPKNHLDVRDENYSGKKNRKMS